VWLHYGDEGLARRGNVLLTNSILVRSPASLRDLVFVSSLATGWLRLYTTFGGAPGAQAA
jgi:hypothetical protein